MAGVAPDEDTLVRAELREVVRGGFYDGVLEVVAHPEIETKIVKDFMVSLF